MRRTLVTFALALPLSAAEFKLPENFLQFNVGKLRSAISAAKPLALLPAPSPQPQVCAHIRVLPAPTDMDPAIALPHNAHPQSKMPILKGPPSCKAETR